MHHLLIVMNEIGLESREEKDWIVVRNEGDVQIKDHHEKVC